jgi:co-chaperonin GroES (HSP10)
VKPVGDRVLVKVDKEEQKSVGGVLLPTAAQSRPTAGSVVSAGDVNMVKVRPVKPLSSIGVKLQQHTAHLQHQQQWGRWF